MPISAGALATRTTVDANGGSLPGSFDPGHSTHLYSVYAGPNLSTHAGDVAVNAAYHVGYTETGSGGSSGGADLFDHSWTHNAEVHAGVKPGEVLPIGISAGAGYYREDISNLDQRVTDAHARVDVTVPLSMELAAVGGVGYEKVQVSGRDALRDSNGDPVVGADGRYVTDASVPRQIAYESSGLIWDAGVVWRPSRRTALEAHVGWRYGSTTYFGSFGWRPSPRSSFNVSVYDSIGGIGGRIEDALVALPTDFEVIRDPVSGDVTSCVATLAKGSCFTSALGSLRSAVFRGRGVQASYAHQLGRFSAGLAAGYDRRKFIAAPGTILAAANGVTDENTWLAAWLSGKLDRSSSFSSTIYANWLRSGFVADGDSTAIGATAAYNRAFGDHLSGTLALSVQGVDRTVADDTWTASALAGLRYSF